MQALIINGENKIGFLKYLSKSIDMIWFDNGNTIPSVNNQYFLDFLVPIPPISEQTSIANFLDDKCGKIDKIIDLKHQKIEELKSYKKSLIYEYVTGKRSVAELSSAP